jgi:chromosome segregation ATPase
MNLLSAKDEIDVRESKNALLSRSIARKISEDKKQMKTDNSKISEMESKNQKLKEQIGEILNNINDLKDMKKELITQMEDEKKTMIEIKEETKAEEVELEDLKEKIEDESKSLQQKECEMSEIEENQQHFENTNYSRKEKIVILKDELEKEKTSLRKTTLSQKALDEKSERYILQLILPFSNYLKDETQAFCRLIFERTQPHLFHQIFNSKSGCSIQQKQVFKEVIKI